MADNLNKGLSIKDINNGFYYIRKANEEIQKHQEALNNLIVDFKNTLGFPDQTSANIIYNTMNTYCFYRLYTSYQFPDGRTGFIDDFLNRIYLPLVNLQSSNTDWIDVLFTHLMVLQDHNLYFCFKYQPIDCGIPYITNQYMLNAHGFKDMYFPVDDLMINTLKRILLKREKTHEIIKANTPILDCLQPFWDDYRFNSLIDCFNSIRNLKDYNYSEIKNYKYCSIVINGLYYIHEISEGEAKLLGDADNGLIQSSVFENTVYPNTPWCLRMQIINPIIELKADFNVILPTLQYFTMCNKGTLDTLAKDFVHLIMMPGIKSRNTIVTGDIDKLNRWVLLFNKMNSYIAFSNKHYLVLDTDSPLEMVDAFMKKQNYYPYKNYIPQNTNPYYHCYYPCTKDKTYADNGNQFIHLNFEYGGRYYELPEPGEHDLIWIAQLFFAHGWHLINKAAQSHRAKTRNVENEFINCLDKNISSEGTRLPLALIYELYITFANSEKQTKHASMTELRALLQKNRFLYNSQKIRKDDQAYINDLLPLIRSLGAKFDEKWLKHDTQKVVHCTVNDKLKQIITTSSPAIKDNENYDDFDKYIKELYSRYKQMFIYNTKFLPKANQYITLGEHLMK